MSAGKTSQNPRMNEGPNQGRLVIFVLDRLLVEDEERAPCSPAYAAKAYLEVLKRLLNSRLAECGRLGPIYLNIEGQGAFRMYPSRAGHIDLNNLESEEFRRLLRNLFQRGKMCGHGNIPVIRRFKHDFRVLFSGFTVIGCVSGKEFSHLTIMKEYAFAPDKSYVVVIGKLLGGGIDSLITENLQVLKGPTMSAEAIAGWVCHVLEEQLNL